MSYSGYTEYLCGSGHYLASDCWEDHVRVCDCGAPIEWQHSVDTTNGSDPEYPESMPADRRLIAEDDVWHADHHGNRYATKRARYAPNSREWRRLRCPSPDGRRMAETENTGSGRKPDQQAPGSK